MDGATKRIGLLDHVGGGNLGDDATQTAVIQNIKTRGPHAQIAGFSTNPDTLSQAISTTADQAYSLTFWRSVTAGGPTELLTVCWNGNQIFAELNPGVESYQQFTLNVTGTGNDTLLFTCANDPGFTYIDDVLLTPVVAAPEPSTMVLLGSGAVCAIVGLIRHRRNRRA